MKQEIDFGVNFFKKDERVKIDVNELVNPHIMIVGVSGSGKSYNLKRIINQLEKIRFFIVDKHGDLEIEKAKDIIIGGTSPYGLNPLSINPDEIFGGIRKNINYIISVISKSTRKVGNRQESVLRNLLTDLYKANGFFVDNPKTWRLEKEGRWRRKYPTFQDLYRFTEMKIKNKLFGMDRESIKKFNELAKLNKRLFRLEKQKHSSTLNEEEKLLETKIEKLKAEIIDTFSEAIKKSNGNEIDDIIKYSNVETLKSVFDLIGNIIGSGIFNEKDLFSEFNKRVIRLLINALNYEEQKMFVYFFAEELFSRVMERYGRSDNVKFYLTIDEAHNFLDKEEDNILKKIVLEARKFGLGVLFATQRIEHFQEDIIENTALKIILGVDESKIKKISSLLKIESKYLENIRPQETGLILYKNKGEKTKLKVVEF